jgi:tetratricopeptide (TPR) repeat protein
LAAFVACGACAPSSQVTTPPSPQVLDAAKDDELAQTEPPAAVLHRAEAALAAGQPARAIALFGRFLASRDGASSDAAQSFLGLARAHEQLHDYAAAIRAYDDWLEHFAEHDEIVSVLARQVAEQPDLLPSVYVEALAREGLALFHLERFEEADRVLARADEIFERARHDDTERFGDYTFVGMARFYRAAILHLAFREVKLELPEQAMEAALQRKLELLTRAQDAYNHTIDAKHMFWVSAAGYQLGHMFGEFYDAVMYAPVPTWLDDRQRAIYYEELKKQLRPVIDKAVWVFDKNLETARRLGYESPFIERTQAKLGHLQAMLISDEASFGRPNPALVQESAGRVAPPEEQEPANGATSLPPAERKLFVPRPTTL